MALNGPAEQPGGSASTSTCPGPGCGGAGGAAGGGFAGGAAFAFVTSPSAARFGCLPFGWYVPATSKKRLHAALLQQRLPAYQSVLKYSRHWTPSGFASQWLPLSLRFLLNGLSKDIDGADAVGILACSASVQPEH